MPPAGQLQQPPHTAAYMMNGQADPRAFGPFGRRSVLRRPTGDNPDGQSPHLSALSMLAERHAGRQQEEGQGRANPFLAPPRASSNRRSRMDDLEDMMMMEAIRLSLASEDERRKKEEKEAKKEAKKKAKEQKKEEKAARKSTLFPTYSNTSIGDGASSLMERSRSNLSSVPVEDHEIGKGKGIERGESPLEEDGDSRAGEGLRMSRFPELSLSGTSQESLAPSIPIPGSGEPLRPSHLRHMSNASSAASSIAEIGPSGSVPTGSTPPEPMFNFQSLAAMIDEDDKADASTHVEHAVPNGTALALGRPESRNGERASASETVAQSDASALKQLAKPGESVQKEKNPIPATVEFEDRNELTRQEL